MSKRILVVDDNPDSVTIMQRILEAQGFEVFTATGGVEALGWLGREKVDLVLLDVMMPEMSGIQVLERIKGSAATESLPVVLVTAKTHDEDVLDGYSYGADYYITKPFTAKQLLFGINLLLGKAETVK